MQDQGIVRPAGDPSSWDQDFVQGAYMFRRFNGFKHCFTKSLLREEEGMDQSDSVCFVQPV